MDRGRVPRATASAEGARTHTRMSDRLKERKVSSLRSSGGGV